jgi:hypothetical protein
MFHTTRHVTTTLHNNIFRERYHLKMRIENCINFTHHAPCLIKTGMQPSQQPLRKPLKYQYHERKNDDRKLIMSIITELNGIVVKLSLSKYTRNITRYLGIPDVPRYLRFYFSKELSLFRQILVYKI